MKIQRDGQNYLCTFDDALIELTGLRRRDDGRLLTAVTVRTADGTGLLGAAQGNFADARLRYTLAAELARRNSSDQQFWEDRLLEVWAALAGDQSAEEIAPLVFQTAADLASSQPERPRWRVRGLLAEQSITELDAKVKVGKTTFTLAMMAAVLKGKTFLGQETARAPVVYLTEERRATFRAALSRTGLEQESRLHILFLGDARGREWQETMGEVGVHLQRTGVGILVVDTLPRWAHLKDDAENDAGAAAEALEPLEDVAAAGCAVLISRHDRKSGGELGDSGRGSSAFSGAADIVLGLRRGDVEGHPNRRILRGIGRFDDVPEQLIIELRGGEYVALGDAVAVERAETRAKLLDTLPGGAPGLTEKAVGGILGGSRSTLRRTLDDMVREGLLHKAKGAGERGTAFGYWLSEEGS